MNTAINILIRLCLGGLLIFSGLKTFGQEDLLSKTISIERQSTTLYNVLNTISEKAGCLFVYSSELLDNNKIVRIPPTRAALKDILSLVVKDSDVQYKVLGKHILIYASSHNKPLKASLGNIATVDSVTFTILKGRVRDKVNREPLAYATVGISGMHRGTVTNMDGFFLLKIPDTLTCKELVVSHLGFTPAIIPFEWARDQQIEIQLERRAISIQEVIIRYIDPVSILTKVVENRAVNNQKDPVYMTSFYREGVLKNDRMLDYSEAVFRIYKSGYELSENADQVKLLKSRKLSDANQEDTISLKLKAGILTALQLDIIKLLPDFLDPETFSAYDFTYSDLISFNHRNAYSVSFSNEQGFDQFNYKGVIYIDVETYALLGADFEVDSRYIDHASVNLVKRKSRKLNVKFERINYSVSYIQFGGNYYLNHVRSDLKIKTRHRNWFRSDHFSAFLELVNCQVDTTQVVRFGRQELIKPEMIFSDMPISYDPDFWGEFNFIAPEEHLELAIKRMNGIIEKIE